MVVVKKSRGMAKLVGESLDTAMHDCSNACIAALRKVGLASSRRSLLDPNSSLIEPHSYLHKDTVL